MSERDEWRPEAEAPSGRWVLARAKEATHAYSYEHWEGWNDTRPAVKLGGDWWMWTDDRKTLTQYRAHVGCVGHSASAVPAINLWAYAPDEWCDIPDGVLERKAG